MFSRKHYKEVADIIKINEEVHPEDHEAMNRIIHAFAISFKLDNPRFDRGLFIHATIATTRPAELF